jgi:hypothetical protein
MPSSSNFQPNDSYDLSATIASGQTASDVIDLGGTDLCGLFIPSTFDGTTLTLQASQTASGTFVTVQSGGSDYTLTTAASKYTPIENLAVVAGLRFIKLVAGTAQSTTDTVIGLAARAI